MSFTYFMENFSLCVSLKTLWQKSGQSRQKKPCHFVFSVVKKHSRCPQSHQWLISLVYPQKNVKEQTSVSSVNSVAIILHPPLSGNGSPSFPFCQCCSHIIPLSPHPLNPKKHILYTFSPSH